MDIQPLYRSLNCFRLIRSENLKQILPEMKLRGLSPNSYIHFSASDFHIPTIGLPILLKENRWTDCVGIYESTTET